MENVIITASGEHIQQKHNLYFGESSIDFPNTKSIYIIRDSKIDLKSVELTEGSPFYFYKIVDSKPLKSKKLNVADILNSVKKQDGKFIYRISVMLDSETAGTYYDNMKLFVNNTLYDINMGGDVIGLDEKLAVLIQNFKQYIDVDYMTAFRESQNNAKSFDYELYNRKIREFLLNMKELTTYGTYKNLFNIIKFFGFGELLDLKEYWTDDLGSFKYTSIINKVVNYIDKSLVGYRKTKMMSLTYKINEQNGYDDDGLPTYENVLDVTDEILTKLYAIKRILERDFLYFGTHIVDIVGEFSAVIGYEMSVYTNYAVIYDMVLTDNLFSDVINLTPENNTTIIKQNAVFVEEILFTPNQNNTKLDFLTVPNNEVLNGDFFDIFKLVDQDTNDYDILTRLYTNNFGIFTYNVELDKSRYTSFGYGLHEDGVGLVYVSKRKNISEFFGKISVGIKKQGKYRMIPYFIDHYGGHTYCGNEFWYDVILTQPKLHIYHYDTEAINNAYLLPQYSTFQTELLDNGYVVPPITYRDFNFGEDLSQWNLINNVRKFTKNYDLMNNQISMNQLNGVSQKTLNNTIKSYGEKHVYLVFDLIGNGLSGSRVLSLGYGETEMHDVDKKYTQNENIIGWYGDLIKTLYTLSETVDVFDDFVYDIVYYSDNPNGQISETRPMLRMRTKSNSDKSIYKFDMNKIFINSDFVDGCFIETANVLSTTESRVEFGLISGGVGELVVKLENGLVFVLDGVTINTISDLYDVIINNTDLSKYLNPIIVGSGDDERIVIYSLLGLEIEHKSFGLYRDVVRGQQFRYVKKLNIGSDVEIGKIFICSIDSDSLPNVSDISWKIFDELSGTLVTTQKSNVLKFLISKPSTYNILLEYTLNGSTYSNYYSGAFLVQ